MSEFQVLGASGYTRPCLIALDMVLSGPLEPQKATVLTKNGDEHLILLWDCHNWPFQGIIIPTGFKSGYGGEGARGFSLALCMLHEQGIPIECMEVKAEVFDKIDNGKFPKRWQEIIYGSAKECEMPVPGWIFVNHWELLKDRQLWRVQWWRSRGIKWTGSDDDYLGCADDVDKFSWTVGDKLHHACNTVKRNATAEMCQQSGIAMRDAWIEFSHAIRERIGEIKKQVGKNDVKAIIDTLEISEELKCGAKKAYSLTNDIQHDRKASMGKANKCFQASTEAMAEIIKTCFPGQYDPRKEDLIGPN